MDKIYGYKEKDIKDFCEYVKNRKNASLTETFTAYATLTGKSKGTIRNMYYAIAKKSREDENFCKKYFDGEKIEVFRGETFNKADTKELLKKVFTAKKQGKSVRSAINEMSGGDMKLALRYQNKYRTAIKNNDGTVLEVLEELNDVDGFPCTERVKSVVPERTFNKLRFEIDSLVNKISDKVRRENVYLKDRISLLELENMRLNNLLYGGKPDSALKYFELKRKKEIIN